MQTVRENCTSKLTKIVIVYVIPICERARIFVIKLA